MPLCRCGHSRMQHFSTKSRLGHCTLCGCKEYNPTPTPVPKPARSFDQWMNWLRAEGFLDGDMVPVGYYFLDG